MSQPYAAAKVLEHLRRPGTHETMVKVSAQRKPLAGKAERQRSRAAGAAFLSRPIHQCVLNAQRPDGVHPGWLPFCASQIAGYILGEFGHLLTAQQAPDNSVSASAMFSLLHDKFPSAS